jgi:hypothetical protein
MNSLGSSIYEHDEVIFTLAWLLNINSSTHPKITINRAVQRNLIRVDSSNHWHANEKNIFRCLNNPKIVSPHHSKTKQLTKLLIGFGEMSARSHGDFKVIVTKKITGFFYKKSLLKVVEEIQKSKRYFVRKRSIDEIGYSQLITKTKFDWNGYKTALRDLNYGTRLKTYNYGISFIISLCLKVMPRQYSFFVEKNKRKAFVGDLCYPAVKPLMFRDLKYAIPLLKSKTPYLKLLACASIVQQELGEKQTSIEENLNILTENEIDIGDAIWLISIKLRDRYQSVNRILDHIRELNEEIKRCEKDPKSYPNGVEPESWIESRIESKQKHEKRLTEAEHELKSASDELIKAWPTFGVSQDQVENLISLIDDEKQVYELAILIPSIDNQIQLLNDILKNIELWIGTIPKFSLDICKENFSYSSRKDLELIANAARSIIRLAENKNKKIGNFLGSKVQVLDSTLEAFICRPFINVRKSNLWQSATSRLASVHLLALHVFDQTPSNKETQISEIVPIVINKVNLLLQVISQSVTWDTDEIFKDLKKVSAHVIATKTYLTQNALSIADDKNLPNDYRVRVILTSETLIKSHWKIAIELFESFSSPPIDINCEFKHFSEWICLLDLCIAYCWKYNSDQIAQEVIRIWTHYCPKYGDKYIDFIGYAKKLYLALLQDGDERIWLRELDGFSQSHCMALLNKHLTIPE